MSIQDVLKKSFLSQFNSELSTPDILVTLIVAAVIGITSLLSTGWCAGKRFTPNPSPSRCPSSP